MALPADFLDELRARTPLPALIGRRVKISRSGRQWKGCCPFHGEKTPSFYVYDDHFHCFGCGAHGDAISFVMQSQGAAFMEAVEQLSAEAGMEVPKPSPATAEAERQRLDLVDVLGRAAASFQRRLFLPEGARGLAYLRGRGLSDDTIRRFGLGWSPGRGALVAELAREEIAPERLIEAGLVQPGEDGPARELFFERAMFPIRDRRGRVVSFGGRTLGDGQPKYLNGPETRVFSKRRSLYALDVAREAARGGAPVVVVEGYMDVLALHQAGFGAAVAPLGTALTVEQLEALWQLSPEPVLCFDGDAAGARAAIRAIELALPLLAPDRTLAVASLPEREDPDTLVRGKGSAAFKKILDAKRPLVEALFDGKREGLVLNSPESRAAYRGRLEAAAAQVGDRGLAREYRRALLDRFFTEGRNGNGSGGQPFPARFASGPRARGTNRLPVRAIHSTAGAPGDPNAERLCLLTAILLCHPALIPSVEEAYLQLALEPWLARLRDQVLGWAEHADVLDSTNLMNHLTEAGLGDDARRALGAAAFALPAAAMRDAPSSGAVEARWRHFFGLLHAERLDAEIDAARREWDGGPEDATQRLITLAEARNKLRDGDDDGDIAE
jgi:DNA primase